MDYHDLIGIKFTININIFIEIYNVNPFYEYVKYRYLYVSKNRILNALNAQHFSLLIISYQMYAVKCGVYNTSLSNLKAFSKEDSKWKNTLV